MTLELVKKENRRWTPAVGFSPHSRRFWRWLHTLQKKQRRENLEKKANQDDRICDEDSKVSIISSQIMPYGVETKEEGPTKNQSVLTQIK